MTNRERFLGVYTEELRSEITRRPFDYGYPVERAPEVAEKMVLSMAKKGANIHGSNPIKRTCRQLGIRCTFDAIAEFLNA